MGKTYKDNREKWKKKLDKKKIKKKNKMNPPKSYSPFEDSQEYHESFS